MQEEQKINNLIFERLDKYMRVCLPNEANFGFLGSEVLAKEDNRLKDAWDPVPNRKYECMARSMINCYVAIREHGNTFSAPQSVAVGQTAKKTQDNIEFNLHKFLEPSFSMAGTQEAVCEYKPISFLGLMNFYPDLDWRDINARKNETRGKADALRFVKSLKDDCEININRSKTIMIANILGDGTFLTHVTTTADMLKHSALILNNLKIVQDIEHFA